MAKVKVKELTKVSLGAKQCTKLCCKPNPERISHSDVWKLSKILKTCPLKDGVEV